MNFPRNVAVIGAGPAGLFAAERLALNGCRVTVYERMASPARKFLLAGRGGLNLTHSEPQARFLTRYVDGAADRVRDAVNVFPPADLIAWVNALGIETFIGSSGRVFPRQMKASPLLRAWLRRLETIGVTLKTAHRWTGFAEAPASNGVCLTIRTADDRELFIDVDAAVLALGGASWPRLGSDGAWVATLKAIGVETTTLAASNCGVAIAWSPAFVARHAGAPLKRIAIAIDGVSRRGEATITHGGLEGGAVYALAPAVRAALSRDGLAEIAIDLRPDIDISMLRRRLDRPRGKQSMSSFLRKSLSLDATAVGLLREGGLPETPECIASRIKSLPLRITGLADLGRAISTAGGVGAEAIDDRLMLHARPGVFVAGEMLDWDAPTGGFLLQAAFATGRAAADGAIARMSRDAAACAADAASQ